MRKLAQNFAALEFWVVGLLVLTSLIWNSLLVAAVIIAAAFWFVRWLATGRFSIRTPADWGILLLSMLAGVSFLISPLPEISTVQILRLVSGIFIYYATINWLQSASRTSVFISIIALAGISISLFSLISVEWAAGKLPNLPIRIFQSFSIYVADTVHPNVMAGTLLLLAPVALAVVIFNRWSFLTSLDMRISYILSGVAFIIVSLILLLTLSRSAWLAYLISGALLFSLRWKRGWLVVIALLGAAASLLIIYQPFDLLGIALESQSLGSLGVRMEVWTRAVYLVEVFPFTGVGMGLYANVADILYPLVFASSEKVLHVHNLFLQIAVDLGLPGLIAWVSILLVVFSVSCNLYRTGRRRNHPWAAGLGAGYFCSALALVLHGLTDAVTWGMVRPAPLVWVVWGGAVASSIVFAAQLGQDHSTGKPVQQNV